MILTTEKTSLKFVTETQHQYSYIKQMKQSFKKILTHQLSIIEMEIITSFLRERLSIF